MFGTSGIRGPVGETVTADLALSVGRAVATEGYGPVVVGQDTRESGEMLRDAVVAGLRECGADVVELGQVSTPTLARSVGWQDAEAGVMITGSHNPPADNGLKLWTPSGQAFDTDQREAISERIEDDAYDLQPWDGIGAYRRVEEAVEKHRQALVESVSVSDSFSVLVDVGNGAGGVTVNALLDLGCRVETLNAQPDGRFPGRPSEPTEANCTSLATFVAESDADLGIAHDGDADRMRAVDETGQFIPGDVLLALFARRAVTDGTSVAVPVDTSLLVEDAVSELGGSVVQTRVGDVFVAERAREDDVVFGGEPSGAWIWPNETLCPDGPLAACKLVEIVSREGSQSELVDDIETYPIRRANLDYEDKTQRMERVAAVVRDTYDDVSTIDGVRINVDDGWMLIRASGTQPLIRVTAEARDEDRAESLLESARQLVTDA